MKKGEIAQMSNLTFSFNVFYGICILKSFDSHIPVVVCSSFEFGTVSKCCIREWINRIILSTQINTHVYVCIRSNYVVGSLPITVKPVLETICIKRPPALRDHCSDTTTLLNPFPNKPWFLRVCSISLLKTL